MLTMAGSDAAHAPGAGGDGAQFSSVFQAGIRWNGYVALGVIGALLGDQGGRWRLSGSP